MGKPVTIDSEDLETLLFCTGAIREIEGTIQRRFQHDDPQLERARPKLSGAIDRATRAFRLTTREHGPDWDKPLSEAAQQQLAKFAEAGITRNVRPDDWTELRARGMVEIGTVHEVIKWGDTKDGTEWSPLAEQVLRVTPRGHQTLALLGTKGNAA